MNRRTLLRGFVAGVSGLLIPPTVGEAAAEVERRYWALGQVPGRDTAAVFDALFIGRATPYTDNIIRIGQINDAATRAALYMDEMTRLQIQLMNENDALEACGIRAWH